MARPGLRLWLDGELLRLPGQWTDAVSADPFVEAVAGRAPFRTGDLLEPVGRVAELATRVASEDAASVRRIMP